MKKYLSLILALVMILSISGTSHAAETKGLQSESSDYQEYIQLLNVGSIDEEISYEYWKELKEYSEQLEKELESAAVEEKERIAPSTGYSMKAGDVFITNGTIASGITGHAGIAISSTEILHIEGIGKKPNVITLTEWNRKYTTDGNWTKVYRHSEFNVGYLAAEWTEINYKEKNAQYVINTDLASTNKTYCSKIVWQAYYYGPAMQYGSDVHYATGGIVGVVLPYELPTKIPGLSLVKVYE